MLVLVRKNGEEVENNGSFHEVNIVNIKFE